MFEAISAIFIVLAVGLGIALNRSINRLAFYEDIYGDMYGHLSDLNENIQGILSREIYSDDPVIKSFIGQLQEIEYYLQQLDENYKFNLLGENVDES
jgi:hypothetical protein